MAVPRVVAALENNLLITSIVNSIPPTTARSAPSQFASQPDGAMVPPEKKRRSYQTIGGVLTVFIIAAFLYYMYGRQSRVQQTRYNQTFQTGKESLRRVDKRSIQELEVAVKLASGSDQEAHAKWDLGLAQILLVSPATGVSTLKEIVVDESYSLVYRSGALIRILGAYMGTRDQNFAKAHIFTGGEPWDSFVKDTDVDEAVRRAYEWGEDFHTTSIGNYMVAAWYGEQLLEDSQKKTGMLTPEQKADFKEKFTTHLAVAEDLVAGPLASPMLEIWEKASMLNMRGSVYSIAYALGNKEDDKKNAEESFNQAIRMISDLPETYASVYREGFSRFFQYEYARFLAYLTRVKKEDHTAKIRELLTPAIEARGQKLNFFTLLRNIGMLPDAHHVKQWTLLIAEVDLRFKELLKELGWTL